MNMGLFITFRTINNEIIILKSYEHIDSPDDDDERYLKEQSYKHQNSRLCNANRIVLDKNPENS
jgi:hypothetical protein